jgi:exodeoxyribonuclease VII small subunit
MSTESPRTFETAISELETCVRRLDGGELELEDALDVFEKGIELQSECQELLDSSERRITELSATAAGPRETPAKPSSEEGH